jgi:hypothetical protein
MQLATFVNSAIRKYRQQKINAMTTARCFTKVRVTLNYKSYANNMFVQQLSELLRSVLPPDSKLTPILLHVAVYFAVVYQNDDGRSRMLESFSRAFYQALFKCLARLAQLEPLDESELDMLHKLANRLNEVYGYWYDEQIKMCTMAVNAVRMCELASLKLTFSALHSILQGYWRNAAYMLAAVKKLSALNEGFYGLMVFEEHKESARDAERELNFHHAPHFKWLGLKALRHIRQQFFAGLLDDDRDENRRLALAQVEIIKELCDERSKTAWTHVCDDNKECQGLEEPEGPVLEHVLEVAEVDNEVAVVVAMHVALERIFRD